MVPLLEMVDTDVSMAGSSHRSCANLTGVPKSRHVKIQRNNTLSIKLPWGTSLNISTQPNLRGMYLWDRWQRAHL